MEEEKQFREIKKKKASKKKVLKTQFNKVAEYRYRYLDMQTTTVFLLY